MAKKTCDYVVVDWQWSNTYVLKKTTTWKGFRNQQLTALKCAGTNRGESQAFFQDANHSGSSGKGEPGVAINIDG